MNEAVSREFNVEGRVAVVTGAASGIGRGIAQLLSDAGALVMAADIDGEGLAETIALINAAGGQALQRQVNVTNRSDVDALADAASTALGPIDIWVNVAGILRFAPIVEASEEDVEAMIAVNLKGVYWGCAAAARAMRPQRRGAIVNISSTGADMAAPGLSVYSLTKAAVNALTRTAAVEFGPLGIRINAVAPGSVDTPMVAFRYLEASGRVDEAKRELLQQERAAASPLGLAGTPRDIALTVLYLASDASRMVTGQVLRPNGGVSMA